MTSLVLSYPRLAIVWPLLFIAVQVLLGWHAAAVSLKGRPYWLYWPGWRPNCPVSSAPWSFSGYSKGITTPEAFDFTAQVWYSPFAPLYALLPRVQYDSIPLYFLVNLLLPFIIAPLPMCGLLLRRSLPGRRHP